MLQNLVYNPNPGLRMARSPSDIIERIGQSQAPEKWFEFPLLVAVSGGADSVALLRILLDLRKRHGRNDSSLIVAHVNHAMRGEGSDEDERFVSRLAGSHELNFRVERLDVDPEADRSEEALREARYRALIQIAKQVDARYIATGHSCDDQVETILFRIFRGTGIGGLAGIPPIRVVDQSISIVRPLLQITRAEILSYLDSLGQDFRTDPSNTDARYSRNFVRHEILPLIREKFGPTADDAILRLANQSLEYQSLLDQLTTNLENAILVKTECRLEIQTQRLQGQPAILVRHFVMKCWQELNWPRQSMTHNWWSQISNSLMQENAPAVVLNLPAEIRLTIAEGVAVFSRSAALDTLPKLASNTAVPEA